MEFKVLTPDQVKHYENCDPMELALMHKELSHITNVRYKNETAGDGDDVSTDEVYEEAPMTLEQVKKIYDHGNVC